MTKLAIYSATSAAALPAALAKLDSDAPNLHNRVSLAEARAVLDNVGARPCTLEQAADYAELLASMCKKGGSDLRVWSVDAVRIFKDWAVDAVDEFVKDPTTGIRSKTQWLPSNPEMLECLAVIAAGKARAVANARAVVAEHERLASEPKQTEEDRQAMAKRIEAKLREFKGQRPLGEVEDLRARQADFNDYARWRGGGDLALGVEITISENISEAPAGWREKCGWQGEVA